MQAWRTYQDDSARAWKSYQARTTTREDYDAEVKRAWLAYQSATGANTGLASSFARKEDALASLRTWMLLEFCHTGQAAASARTRLGIGSPADADSPAFAGLLNSYVMTVASEASRRIENEAQEYRKQSTAEIEARVQRIQANLNTREIGQAYRSSGCDRP
jgi:hypothetical protein